MTHFCLLFVFVQMVADQAVSTDIDVILCIALSSSLPERTRPCIAYPNSNYSKEEHARY